MNNYLGTRVRPHSSRADQTQLSPVCEAGLTFVWRLHYKYISTSEYYLQSYFQHRNYILINTTKFSRSIIFISSFNLRIIKKMQSLN